MRKKGELEIKLDKLFGQWIDEQKEEKEYDWGINGIAIDSFTKDGIVNEAIWNELINKEKKRVLYILREANGNYSESGEEGKKVDAYEFWFRNCVDGGKIGHRIFQRIKEMQKVIQKYNSETGDPNTNTLSEVAYMNLNKRGGGATVDWKIFHNYIEKYKEYIKKEIAIIKPDIIVCCGTYWPLVDNVLGLYRDDQGDKQWNSGDKRDYYYDYHNAEIKDDNGEEHCIRIINMYHPSARISNEDYINKFKERYGDSEEAKNSSESLYWSKKDIYKIIENMDENSEEYAELCDLINNIDAVQKKKES